MTNDLFPSPTLVADEQEAPAITAALVEESRRLNFLPNLFTPRYLIRGEGIVFHLMETMCQEYTGGMWMFYELSNGSGYMVSDMEGSPQKTENKAR